MNWPPPSPHGWAPVLAYGLVFALILLAAESVARVAVKHWWVRIQAWRVTRRAHAKARELLAAAEADTAPIKHVETPAPRTRHRAPKEGTHPWAKKRADRRPGRR